MIANKVQGPGSFWKISLSAFSAVFRQQNSFCPQQHNQTMSSQNQNNELPRDAKLIQLILSSMGVEEYEPRVVNQLMEFMYSKLNFRIQFFIQSNIGYVSDVLQDAQQYALHANKNEITLDDIRLAIQSKVNYSFTQPPPREVKIPFLPLSYPFLVHSSLLSF